MASLKSLCLFVLLAGLAHGTLVLRDSKHKPSPSRFSVVHSPSYVHFASDAGALPAKEVGAMSAYALGLAPSRRLTWNGLMPGSLFRRPKAHVQFVVDGVPSGKQVGVKSQMQTSLLEDHHNPHHALHTVSSSASLASHVSELFHGKSLTFSLAGSHQMPSHGASSMRWNAEKKVFTATSQKDAPFRSLSADELAEQLKSFSWPQGVTSTGASVEVTLKNGNKVTFEMSKQADGEFLAELAATLGAHSQLSAKSALAKDNVPDVLTFCLTGLKTLQLQYGSASPQVEAGLTLLKAVLSTVAEKFSTLYNGDAIVQLIELAYDDHLYQKHTSVIKKLFEHLRPHLRKQTLHQVLADLPRLHLSESAASHQGAMCEKARHQLTSLKAAIQVECTPDNSDHLQVMPHLGRHLLSEETLFPTKDNVTALNLAYERGADWTSTFLMVLLLLLVFFLSLLAISYVLWNMDPGYDSVIYRMTNQRLKME